MTPPREKRTIAPGITTEAPPTAAELDPRHPAIKELENVGVTVGTLYDDVWHDGTYITAAKLVAIGTVLGEPVLTFNVEGTGTYYLIRWAAIGRLKKAVKK